MYAQVEKPKENRSRAAANSVGQKKEKGKQRFGFVDNRPEATMQRKLLCTANKWANHNNAFPVIQRTKDEHAVGDLHYGIHDARYAGYGAMRDEGGGLRVAQSPANPLTVDQMNADSGITTAFWGGGDHMRGYFDVIAMLGAHVTVGTKTQRWLDFLKDNLAYLSIGKHIAQIQSAGATVVVPTKDRLDKNGQHPGIGQTDDGKRNAIVAAYAAQHFDNTHAGYEDQVNAWVWDVFFRRTSKLGIKFTVEEGKTIHMNRHSPAWTGGGDSDVDTDAGNPVRDRQPITHSEMRYINRTYGADHANIDMYHYIAGPMGPRVVDEGVMGPYNQARSLNIQTNFIGTTLTKTNLPGWRAITGNFFRSRPTGVNSIRTELQSNHPNNDKLNNIKDIAHTRKE